MRWSDSVHLPAFFRAPAALALLALVAVVGCRGAERSAPEPAPAASSFRPVLDSHVHITPSMVGLATALQVFERSGVDRFVVKSAGAVGSPRYRATLALQRVLGDRMRAFAVLDWDGIEDPAFGRKQLPNLERMRRDGIVGIKIFKNLGLGLRTADGKLVPPDDPRLDELFAACGRLGLIVAWHVADPVAFFEAPTPDNERWDELQLAPGWSFHGGDFPSHDELIAARDRVLERHPGTTFLLIHLANYPEKLDYVDRLLDTHPNVYVDTSARVPEIGRHPADQVRAFFVKHQDRILFGSDFIVEGDGSMQLGSAWHVPDVLPGLDDAVEFYARHWRFFETTERQIDHPTPIQGRWKVDAIGLPPEVLRKFYVVNAERLLFREPLPAVFDPLEGMVLRRGPPQHGPVEP
ncbi:MAG: amidohydrolase family protein [Deltaproteobacteria bacterium]|nr:amidohydrolase family protein [Deltaproteobacteria bacterium]